MFAKYLTVKFLMIAFVVAIIGSIASAPSTAQGIRTERVSFPPGTSGSVIQTRLVGQDIVDYVLDARGGQRIVVDLATDNPSAYFNLIPAGNPCSRSGESDFTREFLDDSADLVACLPSLDPDQLVANLGGEKVSRLGGWTLISVPRRAEAQGEGLPSIGSPNDLFDFEGARAGQAEMGIQAFGQEAIRGEGLTTFWFNREKGASARIVTSDGRYAEVQMLAAEDF